MPTYRMFCETCGHEGTTTDEYLARELVALHEDIKDGHAPDYEVLEE